MKKVFTSIFLIMFFSKAFATSFDKVVFLGDSLSDNGNLYRILVHVMPKSPPYYNGRFSNGPTWAEQFGSYLSNRYAASISNYAVGGATAIYHPPTDKFATLVTLNMELDKYYLDNLFKDKSKTLFVIWIGDNDYMFDQSVDPDLGTNKVIATIMEGVKGLYDHGAKHFLILNLADASRTPLIKRVGSVEKLHNLVMLHNQKLAIAVQSFAHTHSDVKINFFNLNNFFDEFIDNPDKINQAYQVNITNTNEACWTGGFFLRKPMQPFDATLQIINHVPELTYTYSLSLSLDDNNLPCSSPENYLFWDDIHPTAVVHSVIARVVEEAVGDDL